jgi:hypothetical protein
MMPYTFKPRKSKIKDVNENSLTHLLKNKDLTIEQKRALVAERNPFIYALGTKLNPTKGETK